MNALAELRKRARTPAIPATPAIHKQPRALESQESQESQAVEAEPRFSAATVCALLAPLADALKPLRAHLLALAEAEGIDAAHVHRLHDADVAGCIGLDHRQLGAFLSTLADTADRQAGRVPTGHTAPMHCAHCGLVWAHPGMAAALPMVGGWPRAAGCPWCFVRKAGGYIPRPAVTCRSCAHFEPDDLNPEAGMGTCAHGTSSHFAMAPHVCAGHRPAGGDGL